MSVENNTNVTPFNYNTNNLNDINYVLTRQHSLPAIQVNKLHLVPIYQQRLNYGTYYSESAEMSSSRAKHASIEIYRPPNIRSENYNGGKLNVHAKEFVMNPEKVDGKCQNRTEMFAPKNFLLRNVNEPRTLDRHYSLNTSKSSTTLNTKTNSSQTQKSNNSKLNSTTLSNFNLQRAKSSGNMLMDTTSIAINPQKVQFKARITQGCEKNFIRSALKGSASKEKKTVTITEPLIKSSLKRSKSLNAADALKFMEMEASFSNPSVSFADYQIFPEEMHDLIKRAAENTNTLVDKQKMYLARYVVEYVLCVKKYASSVAKFSIIIMEQDNTGAYLDSLLNTCQMMYQKKETCLLKDNFSKFTLFVTFLTEMYIELKRSKLQLKFQSDPVTPPKLVLLTLISRCCEDILVLKEEHSLPQIECLFQALTSVGRDLETELPDRLKKLYGIVRDVFLKSSDPPEVKKTLLQLIELKAANWQLPVSALNFYYSKSSN